jgi:4-coumarate--CoA ligase
LAPSSIAVGELVPGLSAKLIREDGTEETRRGHRGELWVRGPNVMKCYWRNVEATTHTKTCDGWLKTGDVAYVDQDGKWYIVDRKKVCICHSEQSPGWRG